MLDLFAEITEKPSLVDVLLIPTLFLLLGIFFWFSADYGEQRKKGSKLKWVWPYLLFAFALYVSGSQLFELLTNRFVQALFLDDRKTMVAYYAGFGLSVVVTASFATWQYFKKKYKVGELVY